MFCSVLQTLHTSRPESVFLLRSIMYNQHLAGSSCCGVSCARSVMQCSGLTRWLAVFACYGSSTTTYIGHEGFPPILDWRQERQNVRKEYEFILWQLSAARCHRVTQGLANRLDWQVRTARGKRCFEEGRPMAGHRESPEVVWATYGAVILCRRSHRRDSKRWRP